MNNGFLILKILINLRHLRNRKNKIISLNSEFGIDKCSLRLLHSKEDSESFNFMKGVDCSSIVYNQNKSIIYMKNANENNSPTVRLLNEKIQNNCDDANQKLNFHLPYLNDVFYDNQTLDNYTSNSFDNESIYKFKIQSKIKN